MSCKVAETTHNIINTSGPGAASKCSVAVIEEVGIHGTLLQFKKFCEGDKSPENEEHNCQPAEVDNNQLRAITEADPLKTTWESCQRFQCHPFYGHSAFEANWKGEKSSVSGCLMSWPKKKKKKNQSGHFEVSSLILLQQGTISSLDCDVQQKVDFIWQTAMSSYMTSTQWLGQEEAPMHFPKPNLHQRKVIVTVWWSATSLIHYSFLNPIKSEKHVQQISEKHWRLQCLQLVPVNRMGPILHGDAWPHIAQPTLQKMNKLGHEVLPQFSSVQSHSHVWLCDPIDCSTPGLPVLHQFSELAQTHVHRLTRRCHPTSSSSVVPFSSHLQSFPAWGSFSNESVLCIRWPKYWSFSFNISPSNEHPGLISLRIDWLDLLAVQGTLTSLLQHHSSKASFFGAQLSL